MFFRRLKASQSTLNLCSEAELSIVCYTYGIDARRGDILLRVCLPFYGGLIVIDLPPIDDNYIFVHARKSGRDTVKRREKSR